MRKQDPVRQCSFCHKKESEHGIKLISSPAVYPQAFICDACVAVCASILEDDGHAEVAWRISKRAAHDPQTQVPAPHPVAPPESALSHPMASELMALIEQWITRETSGHDASAELSRVRASAKLMFVNRDA